MDWSIDYWFSFYIAASWLHIFIKVWCDCWTETKKLGRINTLEQEAGWPLKKQLVRYILWKSQTYIRSSYKLKWLFSAQVHWYKKSGSHLDDSYIVLRYIDWFAIIKFRRRRIKEHCAFSSCHNIANIVHLKTTYTWIVHDFTNLDFLKLSKDNPCDQNKYCQNDI